MPNSNSGPYICDGVNFGPWRLVAITKLGNTHVLEERNQRATRAERSADKGMARDGWMPFGIFMRVSIFKYYSEL